MRPPSGQYQAKKNTLADDTIDQGICWATQV